MKRKQTGRGRSALIKNDNDTHSFWAIKSTQHLKYFEKIKVASLDNNTLLCIVTSLLLQSGIKTK